MTRATDKAVSPWQDRLAGWSMLFGRLLLALLFALGAWQKLSNPAPVKELLTGAALPAFLVWPAMLLNGLGALALLLGLYLPATAAILALYCMITSLFHFVPEDPWQMSILVKNWAIAGGLLVLCAHEIRYPKG